MIGKDTPLKTSIFLSIFPYISLQLRCVFKYDVTCTCGWLILSILGTWSHTVHDAVTSVITWEVIVAFCSSVAALIIAIVAVIFLLASHKCEDLLHAVLTLQYFCTSTCSGAWVPLHSMTKQRGTLDLELHKNLHMKYECVSGLGDLIL